MFLENQYTLLQKSNDMSTETLNAANRQTLKNIQKYMLCMTWNCYEIERVRKDLIDMAARCELEGRTLEEEVGGDIERFLLELVPDLPRGTPLDYVCIWYPRWLLVIAAMYFIMALLPNAQDLNLFRILSTPFLIMLYMFFYAWFHRMSLKIKVRYGALAQAAWYLPFLLFFTLTCFVLPVYVLQEIPGTISYLGAFLYELAWAIGCQIWQTIFYNRWAARHPWQEA